MTWRLTVAMLSEVTAAMTSRPTGPRSRTARKTDAAAESEMCKAGGRIWRCIRGRPLRLKEWWLRVRVVRMSVLLCEFLMAGFGHT